MCWQQPRPMQQVLQSQGGLSETLGSKAEIAPRFLAFQHVSSWEGIRLPPR